MSSSTTLGSKVVLVTLNIQSSPLVYFEGEVVTKDGVRGSIPRDGSKSEAILRQLISKLLCLCRRIEDLSYIFESERMRKFERCTESVRFDPARQLKTCPAACLCGIENRNHVASATDEVGQEVVSEHNELTNLTPIPRVRHPG